MPGGLANLFLFPRHKMTKKEERLLWWKMRNLRWWEDIFPKEYYRPDLSPEAIKAKNNGKD
jgi:hypothetical protein